MSAVESSTFTFVALAHNTNEDGSDEEHRKNDASDIQLLRVNGSVQPAHDSALFFNCDLTPLS